MDSLTQIVLGAAVGEAIAGRKMGAKAALWGAIGGTLPDLDVFLRNFYHPFDAALVHRGFSHSLLFAVITGPLFGWIFHRLYKRRYSQRDWLLLWFLSIVTHPILDMFTNYGTQFLWPLDLRITFNTVFVIDPLYTLPFMTLLIMALFTRRDDPRRRKRNMAGIYLSSGYLLWGVIIKLVLLFQAPSYFESAGVKSNRIMVTPMPLTSFYWQMVAENDTGYYIGYKSLFGSFHRQDIEFFPKNHEVLNRLHWRGKNRSKQLAYISNGYYSTQLKHDTIIYYDLRFGSVKQLSGERFQNPLMGYGMIVDKGTVQKSFPLRPGEAFKAVNFGHYMHKVFGE